MGFGQNVSPDTVVLDDLEFRENRYYRAQSGNLFTGFKKRSPHSTKTTETSEGRLVEGKPEGLWTFWRSTGQKTLTLTFDAGKREGPWTYFNEKENVKIEGNYKAGWISGEYILWTDEGEKEVVLQFEPDYWLEPGFNYMDYFGGSEHVFQFSTEEDGVISTLMAAGPCEYVYSLENVRYEQRSQTNLLLKVLVFILIGILLFIKPKDDRLIYKFSLWSRATRMVYLQIILWMLVYGTGAIVVVAIFSVFTMFQSSNNNETMSLLMIVRYMPQFVLAGIVGIIVYFVILTLAVKKGFRVLAAYKKSLP